MMNIEDLDEIIKSVDSDYEGGLGNWVVSIEGISVQIIAVEEFDRMRILIPILPVENLDERELQRILQANFDTSLDSRYAIAQNLLWSLYIHPLSPLQKDQFLSALAQVVSSAKTFGTTYSSGLFNFGGGDSITLNDQLMAEELKKNDRLN